MSTENFSAFTLVDISLFGEIQVLQRTWQLPNFHLTFIQRCVEISPGGGKISVKKC